MKQGRAQWFLPEELDDEQREYYDRLINGQINANRASQGLSAMTDSDGRLTGPHNVRLLNPKVGRLISELAEALRFHISLSDRCAEICVLETARNEQSNFEWAGHSSRARSLGISDTDIKAILSGKETSDLNEEEQLVRHVARTINRDRDIPNDLFAQAERVLGQPAIFDIVSIIGHYQHTALSLRIWRAPLRPGADAVFETKT